MRALTAFCALFVCLLALPSTGFAQATPVMPDESGGVMGGAPNVKGSLYRPGQECTVKQIGETRLDEDSTALIACLYLDASKSKAIWKSMNGTFGASSDVTSPSGYGDVSTGFYSQNLGQIVLNTSGKARMSVDGSGLISFLGGSVSSPTALLDTSTGTFSFRDFGNWAGTQTNRQWIGKCPGGGCTLAAPVGANYLHISGWTSPGFGLTNHSDYQRVIGLFDSVVMPAENAKLGIGTTDPEGSLDVYGKIYRYGKPLTGVYPVSVDVLHQYHSGCSHEQMMSIWPALSFYCVAACNRYCAGGCPGADSVGSQCLGKFDGKGYAGGTLVEYDGGHRAAACACF